jgi:NADPH2:quinone reductase
MQAIRIHALGGPEVMVVEEIPDPVPGPGEVLVEVAAIGVNFIDIYQRTGQYKGIALPFTPGQEAAGTVRAVGAGVSDFAAGDRVAYCGPLGAYAQLAVVPAGRLVKIPAAVGFREAAAVMLQGMTAHYLACTTAPLRSGMTCLVHAAAGGVGLLLCQIAKRRGARVIGTVSSDEKAQHARAAGADVTIDYTRENFVEVARRETAGKGVEVVYDGVGRVTFDGGLESLAPRGMMVLYGQASGAVAPIDPQVLNARGSLFLTRPSLYHYMASREELLARAGDLFQWIAEGLTVRIDRVLPLAEAAAAQEALASRETSGKVVLVP